MQQFIYLVIWSEVLFSRSIKNCTDEISSYFSPSPQFQNHFPHQLVLAEMDLRKYLTASLVIHLEWVTEGRLKQSPTWNIDEKDVGTLRYFSSVVRTTRVDPVVVRCHGRYSQAIFNKSNPITWKNPITGGINGHMKYIVSQKQLWQFYVILNLLL